MSTATEQEPLEPDPSAGRLLRRTVRIAAGALVASGLIAWMLVSHMPVSAPAGPAARKSAGSSTLFYHASNQMSFRGGGDGRYYVDAEMNENKIRFVVDPGTPTVMLSLDDARTAGIDTGKLSFSTSVVTPDGETRVASVMIPMLTLKQLTLFNVKGTVAEGSLSTSVLGLDFLKRFDSYTMRDGELVLRW